MGVTGRPRRSQERALPPTPKRAERAVGLRETKPGPTMTDTHPQIRRLALLLANDVCDLDDERAVYRALAAKDVDAGDIVLYADDAVVAARTLRPKGKTK